MTYVTCPTIRYHPAIVALKAATLGILSGDRFRLGLGAGENLNEHVVGERWPAVGQRHAMLREAVQIDVEQARLWDLPDQRVPIGIAVSGLGAGKGRVGQIALSYDPDREAASSAPTPSSAGSASAEQVADQLGCGPDVEEHVAKIRPFIDAGFTEVALVQIGGEHQARFIRWAEDELLPALRSL